MRYCADDYDDNNNNANVDSEKRRKWKKNERLTEKKEKEECRTQMKKFRLTMVFIKKIFIKRTMEFILTTNLNLIFAAIS